MTRRAVGTDGTARNPRREALRILRVMASNVRSMVSTWDQRQTTHEREATSGRVSYTSRKLRPDERMENQAEAWDRLALYMDTVAMAATDLAGFARTMATRVRQGDRW